ncbi:DEAD/DEAH box helicase family protein [Sphingorhabdus sp.]|uniref:DEAD/DEAH box helicase family protein n=1 Tax=Sphingorhabdus sp. TaxID=1902408 RepID=UPI003D819487
MSDKFNIADFLSDDGPENQYQEQLKRIQAAENQTECIEDAVNGALANLSDGTQKSFVIYGEPQSGKTEMMICLTAKLLDEGFRFIIHLLNDSVDLLGQNMSRFHSSGLAPSAQNFAEILDPSVDVKNGKHIVFCKKNGSDLRKLINKIGNMKNVIVIDDEADYATPNSKVNKGDKTSINDLSV